MAGIPFTRSGESRSTSWPNGFLPLRVEAAGIEPASRSVVSHDSTEVRVVKNSQDGGKDGDSSRNRTEASKDLGSALLRRAAEAAAAGEDPAPYLAAYEAERDRARREDGDGKVLKLGG